MLLWVHRNNPQSAEADRGSKGPKDKGSGLRRSQSFRGLENRVAGEYLDARIPPVRTLDRVRIDVPAVVTPAHADRAKYAILVPNVEDGEITVVQESATLTVLLLLHKGEHLRQGGFSFRFATEFSDDRTVHRRPPQFVVTERLFADRVFDFTFARQEPAGEVVLDCRDLHQSVGLGVDHEPVFGDKIAGGCGDGDRSDSFEQKLGLGGFDMGVRRLRKEATCKVLFQILLD